MDERPREGREEERDEGDASVPRALEGDPRREPRRHEPEERLEEPRVRRRVETHALERAQGRGVERRLVRERLVAPARDGVRPLDEGVLVALGGAREHVALRDRELVLEPQEAGEERQGDEEDPGELHSRESSER